jgi:hypothetical protein
MTLTRRTPLPPDDKPPPLAKRTPVDEYDRCRECGTAEGQPCYDSNDKPMTSVCQGRTLSSSGALDREARNRYKKKKARTRESDTGLTTPTRAKPVAQKTNPCKGCSNEIASPRVWCLRRICRAAAAKEYRQTAPKTEPTVLTCVHCGSTYEAVGGAKHATLPHCRAPACRVELKRARNARRRQRAH